jgi:vitamin B12 transporter
MGQDRGDKDTGEEKKEEVQVIELKELVVTATRTEKKLADVTASITVISAGEIEGRKAETVSELLRGVPGVCVRQEGPAGSRTSVLLRGTHSTQTLVLIDGIEVNDPNLGGSFDLADLDTSNIERIEVVRGSQSALYGSSAVGGVINIITKKGKGEPKLFAEAWGGSFDHARAQVGGSGATDKSYWSFAAVDFSTNNNMPHNSYARQGFFGKFGMVFNDDMKFEFLAHIAQSEHESPYDYTNPLTLDRNISRRRDQCVIGAKFEHKASECILYHLKASVFDIDNFFQNRGDLPGDPDEFTSTAQATVSTLNGQVKFDIGRVIATEGIKDELVVGGEIKKIDSLNFTESPWSAGLGFDDVTESRAAYLQNELNLFEVFTVTAGVRADKYGSLKTNYLPRVGLGYKVDSTKTTFKGNYGKGFRTPSPIEFFDPWVGNLDLKPEKSKIYDIGVEQTFLDKNLKLGLTYFRIDVKDLIAWSSATGLLENVSEAKIEGTEFALKWKPTKSWRFGLSFTHQYPRDTDTHTRLTFRSCNFGGFEVAFSKEKFNLALTGFFSEPIHDEGVVDEKGEPQKRAGNVKLVNLAASYRVSKNAELLFKITNLLDERYKESQREPKTPGIGVFVGVSAEF